MRQPWPEKDTVTVAQTPYQVSHEDQHTYFPGQGDPEWIGEKCDPEGSCMLGAGFISLILS